MVIIAKDMLFIDKFVKNHPIKKVRIKNIDGKYIVGGKSKIGFLIFPGGGQDIYSSYDLIEAYEKDYKVISLSINGFDDLKTYFEFVNKILEKEKITKVIVYGLSLGGFIAQHYVRANKEKVIKLILSHTGSTRSQSIRKKVIIPGKILYFFLPIIPLGLVKLLVKKNAGKTQSGSSDVKALWNKYSSKENLLKRMQFIERFGLDFLNRSYLNSFYRLGIDMEKSEKQWKYDEFNSWSKNVLIIKTDSDPLAQDDGELKKYYPQAKEYIFFKTGHLTPFIRFEDMKRLIDEFINSKPS